MIDARPSTVLVAVMLCAAVACATGGAEVVPLPADLSGRWETDAPAYADRYIEISEDIIVIGTGESTFERYTIDRVLREVNEDGVLFTIDYSDADEQAYDIGFYFDSAAGGTIRLRNQRDMVWRKVPPQSTK